MPTRKLDETENFIELYLHAAGVTRVPEMFHTWSCISLIAACLANRVWYEKFLDDKMYPNMYIILIAESGIGKGKAIDNALKFVAHPRYEEIVNPYRAKITGAGFSDVLGKPKRDEDGRVVFDPEIPPLVYLVTPELTHSLGEQKIADDFVKRMTELYTGGDYQYHEATRGHGELSYKCPIINWIAGSTNTWMHKSIPRDAIESGFFGRTIPIELIGYDHILNDRGNTDPWYPPDRAEVVDYLHKRVRWMTTLEGRFTLSNQAKEVRDVWYRTRPVPSDPAEMPSWMRADDLVLKLAMILAVAAGRDDFTITSKHITKGIALAGEAHRAVPNLVRTASRTPATTALDITREFIQLAKRIPHSALLKKIGHRGIHAKELALHIDTLKQQKLVGTDRTDRGAVVYTWLPKTQEVFDGDGSEEG